MTALAELRVNASLSAPIWDRLRVDARLAEQSPYPYSQALRVDASMEHDLRESVRPRTGPRQQLIGHWQVSVNGVPVPAWKRLPGTYVEYADDGSIGWGFGVPLHGRAQGGPFYEPLGSPLAWSGPPGGKGAVDIDCLLLLADGVLKLPLVRNGVIDNSSGSVGEEGSDRRDFRGLGPLKRFDRALATLTFPPGHGQPRGTVVRRLLTAAGVPAASLAIAGGARMYKGLQAVDQNALDLATALLRPEIRGLEEQRDGTVEAVREGYDESRRVEWVFREQDILSGRGSFGDQASSDGPTSVLVTGTSQVTREECGMRTVVSTVDSYSIYAPRVAVAKQFPVSTITATGASQPAAALILTNRVVRELVYDCDTLLIERVLTYGWYNPQVHRYTVAATADGAINGYNQNVYFYELAASDDSTPAYLWPTERFTLLSIVTTRHEFDSRGLKVKATTTVQQRYQRRTALKTRTLKSTAWEGVAHNGGGNLKILASGEAVTDSWEGFWSVGGGDNAELSDPRRTETLTITASDDGYVLAEEKAIEEWTHRNGWEHLYGSGEESRDVSDQFFTVGRELTTYGKTPEGAHQILWQRFDVEGKLVEQKLSEGDGHLPAAERQDDLVPPDSTFTDPADAEFARAASRFESQPIKIRIQAPSLATVRELWEEKLSDEWAENVGELEALGIHHMRETSAIEVQFALPFNPLVRRRQRVHLNLPSVGIDWDVFVGSVRHQEDEDVTWTQVAGRVYVV